jgi:hypothetical protein
MKTQTLRTKLGELRDSLSDRLGIAKKRVLASPRKRASPGRRVTFGAVKVTEFERLLCGGGGVPDGDVVSLGQRARPGVLANPRSHSSTRAHTYAAALHMPPMRAEPTLTATASRSRCSRAHAGLGAEVRSYETVPRDRPRNADKDTYCMRGCLDVSKRAELLCEWMRKKEYLVLLRYASRAREGTRARPCAPQPAVRRPSAHPLPARAPHLTFVARLCPPPRPAARL